MRLDEPEQTDTVLGDGSRDRGALADQISTAPDLGAGIAYVRLEGNPDQYASAPPGCPMRTSRPCASNTHPRPPLDFASLGDVA